MKQIIIIVLIAFSYQANAQIDFINSVNREQDRIDGLDGKTDGAIDIGTVDINNRANAIYISALDTFKKNISKMYPNAAKRNKELIKILPFFKEISHKNYAKLSHYEKCFKIINALYDSSSNAVCLAICKSYPMQALELSSLFAHREFAKDLFLHIGEQYPFETLAKSGAYSKQPYLVEVVKDISYRDPNSAKQFLGTRSPVNRVLVNSDDRVLKKIVSIYQKYGQNSQSFVNIDACLAGRINMAQSEAMNQDKSKHLNWLIDERMRDGVLASRSIERRVQYLSHVKVEDINELHDNPNESVRFRSVRNASSQELYTLMVYTNEEIYTSSFLGLYKRWKNNLNGQTGFQFLKTVEFNKFRTFIKECAGFNTLDDFFNTMPLLEKDSLLDLVIDDLDNTPGDIMAAVEVADIYGSLTDTALANTFRHKIYMDYLLKSRENNDYGEFIYGMLYKLCGGDAAKLRPLKKVTYTLPDLTKLTTKDLFSDGQNVQQHLFFDDEDGEASYRSFMNSFRGDANWRIVDQENYVCIKSRKGWPVLIFANKPSREAQGQEELAALFASLGRYPDIAVHRGHSYYLDGTIDILNQSTKIAILGSCGGYHHVATALENAQDVQIVSTKQIGTMSVNDVLIKDMAEVLRKGNTLDWKPFWLSLEKKLKNNSKFYDYIPPYKNLGAMLIRAYRIALEEGELEGIY